jgi:hypothetical protein
MNNKEPYTNVFTDYAQTQMFELCPVCQTHNVIKGGRYCSPACYNIAYNFRKRLMVLARFLRSVGFRCTMDRTLVTVEMPEQLKPYYPKETHKFYFPQPGMKLAELSAVSLWRELRFMLGYPLVDFLEWLCDRDGIASHDGINLLSIMAYTLYHIPAYTSRCHVCENQFIKSHYAVSGSPAVCVDCMNALFDHTTLEG